jgi:hypothetical protein
MTMEAMTMGAAMFVQEKPKPWLATSAALTTLLDGSYKALKDAEPRRTYLGASMMGKECARAVAFEYHGTPKDPDKGFSGQLYRVFDMGHDGEARMGQYLRIAGFNLIEKRSDGEQFGYCVIDGLMQGHIDGVITAGPDVDCAWPALWENKALNNDGFNSVKAKGVEKAKPLYFAQVQVYMAYMALDRTLFTCLNRNTGEVFAEIIELDVYKAQVLSDRGVNVVRSARPEDFPRIARDETDFRCRFCDYHRTCWGGNSVEHQSHSGETPLWLTGG